MLVMYMLLIQNWKTQRPSRDDLDALLHEAVALPCRTEEQLIIARLLSAYDRWLVLLPLSPSLINVSEVCQLGTCGGIGVVSISDVSECTISRHVHFAEMVNRNGRSGPDVCCSLLVNWRTPCANEGSAWLQGIADESFASSTLVARFLVHAGRHWTFLSAIAAC